MLFVWQQVMGRRFLLSGSQWMQGTEDNTKGCVQLAHEHTREVKLVFKAKDELKKACIYQWQ